MDLNITNEPGRADPRTTSKHDTQSKEIAFATGKSALGTVLVARSAQGICAILIGPEAGELTADLAVRFPENTLVRNDRRLDGDLRKILRFIETPARGLDLELDIHGTPFQRRAGQTVTYAALARRIGEPGSARAVANACAANAIALAIPCHRVVRSDGTLSGYRWGVERKRALIAREALV